MRIPRIELENDVVDKNSGMREEGEQKGMEKKMPRLRESTPGCDKGT